MRDIRRLLLECIAELIGTFLLVLFGTGSVYVGALTGALSGLFQVAIVWGIVIALAIYATSAISGTHINPPSRSLSGHGAGFRGTRSFHISSHNSSGP